MVSPAASVVDLDACATTPLDPRVLERMLATWRSACGNASSGHALGASARQSVEQAREQVAELVGARPDEIFFTSGATESINLAIRGTVDAAGARPHVVVSRLEHSAVHETILALHERGLVSVGAAPNDAFGCVTAQAVAGVLTETTALVCVIHGNNEIGTINPIADVGRHLARQSALFFVDAAQTAGYVPISLPEMGVHLACLSAHKMHGPTGVGALYARRDVVAAGRVRPILTGGRQERGLRPGTLNVPGIVGFGEAARIAREDGAARATRVAGLRDGFLRRLRAELPDVRLNGHPIERLAGNLSLTLPGVDALQLQARLPHLAFARGSACNSASSAPSHVLKALGLAENDLRSTIRVSLSAASIPDEVERAAIELAAAAARLRCVQAR